MVQARASSQPPPRAKPLTAAMTGLPQFSMRENTAWPRVAQTPAASTASESGEFVDVGTGNEGFFAFAGEDGNAHIVVIAHGLEGAAEFLHGGGIECVEHLGTRNGDECDLIFLFVTQVFKCGTWT